MEQSKRQSPSIPFTIMVVAFIYLVIITLMILLENQLLKDLSSNSEPIQVFTISLAVVIPLILLIILLVNITKLIRDSRRQKSGTKFKIKLMIFFALIAILSSIPQTVLSVNFLNTALSSWFSSETGEALERGVGLAIKLNTDKRQSLQSFMTSAYFKDAMRRYPDDAERNLETFNRLNNNIQGIQVFKNQEEIAWAGESEQIRLETPPEVNNLPVKKTSDYTMYHGVYNFQYRGNQYTVVLTSHYNAEIDTTAALLTRNAEYFHQWDLLSPQFKIVLLLFYVIFSMPILLLSILMSFYMSEDILRPIFEIESATDRIAGGDFEFRIMQRQSGELSSLISSFNTMISELQKSRLKDLQTDKVEAWQEIAQRMAHEIKNPLTPIKLSAQRILRKYQRDPAELEMMIEPAISSIIKEVENLNLLLQEFRNFSRLPSPHMKTTNLKELILEVLSVYNGHHSQIEIEYSKLDEKIELLIDRDQIKQVFSNLLKNAIESINVQGVVTITSHTVHRGNSTYCRIAIQDTGIGINRKDFSKVFNPYYTSKNDGTGLGLPIVERIIFDHKGQIWFESEENVGTTFFIDLPLSELSL